MGKHTTDSDDDKYSYRSKGKHSSKSRNRDKCHSRDESHRRYSEFSDSKHKTSQRHQKDSKIKEEESKIDQSVLNDLNKDEFTSKEFVSKNKAKALDNIVINLKEQTIKVPKVEPTEPDSIFHQNLFLNEEMRMEKWIKEIFVYRQKALQQKYKK